MKIEAPGPDVPIQLEDGTVNPLWYVFFTKRGVLDMPDVDAAGITNNQVLIFNGTTRKLKPGSN